MKWILKGQKIKILILKIRKKWGVHPITLLHEDLCYNLILIDIPFWNRVKFSISVYRKLKLKCHEILMYTLDCH